MSLESGRKLGLTASLIAVIGPVIMVFSVIIFIASLFFSIFSGAVGSSLAITFLAFIAVIGLLGLISLAGMILFLVAMHRLAEYYREPGIFKNALYGFIINIIGISVVIVIEFAFFLTSIGNIFNLGNQGTQTVAATPAPTIPPFINIFTGFSIGVVALVLLSVAVTIISGVMYMRAFNKLGEKSGVNSFNTAGLLYVLGAALSVVGIGVLLYWIAWIFSASGFHALKPAANQTNYYQTQQYFSQSMGQKKFCPHCGAENKADSIYCSSCGKPLM